MAPGYMNHHVQNEEDEHVYAERPNRNLQKREREASKALVLRMMGMSDSLFQSLDIPEELQDAVQDAKRFKTGARKRQIRYATTMLLRLETTDEINTQIDRLQRPAQQEVEAFHEIEQWRDQLIAGDNDVLNTLIAQLPDLDVQRLRQLVRNANKEAKTNKPPKSARQLFQYLKELQTAND